jgi:D-alanyl-D-alanine carboxypeptidase
LNQSITKLVAASVVAIGGLASYVGIGLSEHQAKCAHLQSIHNLLLPLADPRMRFTDGEARRTPEQAALNAHKGIGISQSLHIIGLARDKNLFIDGKYTSNPKDYLVAGVLWEELGKNFGMPTAWGGRWKSVDAVHFSCPRGGIQ